MCTEIQDAHSEKISVIIGVCFLLSDEQTTDTQTPCSLSDGSIAIYNGIARFLYAAHRREGLAQKLKLNPIEVRYLHRDLRDAL